MTKLLEIFATDRDPSVVIPPDPTDPPEVEQLRQAARTLRFYAAFKATGPGEKEAAKKSADELDTIADRGLRTYEVNSFSLGRIRAALRKLEEGRR